MSQQILEGAKCDHDLSLRVAGVNDLIAAEGKYHPNCYKKILRNVSRSRDIAKMKVEQCCLGLSMSLKSLLNKVTSWGLGRVVPLLFPWC